MPRAKKPPKRLAKNSWERSRESRAASQKGERRALEEAHALRALLTRTPHHPAADPAAAAATHNKNKNKKRSIGLGDDEVIRVWLKYTHTHVHTGAGEWLDAKVLRVDEAIGLYCVGRWSLRHVLHHLGRARAAPAPRLVATMLVGVAAAAVKPTIAKELAADAAELADIETWDEGTLRANQNTCSARTQRLIKIIRDRRNAAKRAGAMAMGLRAWWRSASKCGEQSSPGDVQGRGRYSFRWCRRACFGLFFGWFWWPVFWPIFAHWGDWGLIWTCAIGLIRRTAERRREMKARFAAEAPTRAKAKAAKAERRRAEKARRPPPTRASHPRPEFVLRALGGSKRAPDDAPPEKRGARRPPARAPP